MYVCVVSLCVCCVSVCVVVSLNVWWHLSVCAVRRADAGSVIETSLCMRDISLYVCVVSLSVYGGISLCARPVCAVRRADAGCLTQRQRRLPSGGAGSLSLLHLPLPSAREAPQTRPHDGPPTAQQGRGRLRQLPTGPSIRTDIPGRCKFCTCSRNRKKNTECKKN